MESAIIDQFPTKGKMEKKKNNQKKREREKQTNKKPKREYL